MKKITKIIRHKNGIIEKETTIYYFLFIPVYKNTKIYKEK
jgi:hypothetical protein